MSPSPLRLVREAVQSSLAPTPDDLIVVDYILSIVASNFFQGEGDPLWGWIIGPPGSMKTEALRPLRGHDDTVFLSTLTTNSLISGYEAQDGSDPSLVKDWDGKTVVIKEFTSILGLPEKNVRTIFGDLRGIFDGFHGKGFGTVGIRTHKARFTMLAAVTPAIDRYTIAHTELGERFIALRVSRIGLAGPAERDRLARHVWNASDTKATWRESLRNTMGAAIAHFRTKEPPVPAFTAEQEQQLIDLANFLSLLRTMPSGEGAPVAPEVPTRTVQQAKYLAAGRCCADDRSVVSDKDIGLVARMVFDSLPVAVTLAISAIVSIQKKSEWVDLRSVVSKTHIPMKWLSPVCTQYQYCRVLKRNGGFVRLNNGVFQKLHSSGLLSAAPAKNA